MECINGAVREWQTEPNVSTHRVNDWPGRIHMMASARENMFALYSISNSTPTANRTNARSVPGMQRLEKCINKHLSLPLQRSNATRTFCTARMSNARLIGKVVLIGVDKSMLGHWATLVNSNGNRVRSGKAIQVLPTTWVAIFNSL